MGYEGTNNPTKIGTRSYRRTRRARALAGGQLHAITRVGRRSHLEITTARVLFIPGKLAAFSFAPLKVQEHRLADLESVGIEKPDHTPYTGGMRTRLRLNFRGGSTMLVRVKHLDQAISEVQAIMAGRG
jgi:hypothetical protein